MWGLFIEIDYDNEMLWYEVILIEIAQGFEIMLLYGWCEKISVGCEKRVGHKQWCQMRKFRNSVRYWKNVRHSSHRKAICEKLPTESLSKRKNMSLVHFSINLRHWFLPKPCKFNRKSNIFTITRKCAPQLSGSFFWQIVDGFRIFFLFFCKLRWSAISIPSVQNQLLLTLFLSAPCCWPTGVTKVSLLILFDGLATQQCWYSLQDISAFSVLASHWQVHCVIGELWKFQKSVRITSAFQSAVDT